MKMGSAGTKQSGLGTEFPLEMRTRAESPDAAVRGHADTLVQAPAH